MILQETCLKGQLMDGRSITALVQR